MTLALEPVLMMAPPPLRIINGMPYLQQRKMLWRLVARTLAQVSSASSVTGPSRFALGAGHQRLHVGAARAVRAHEGRLAAGGAELRLGLAAKLLADLGDDDLGALAHEGLRPGKADAPAGTGDDGNLAFESHDLRLQRQDSGLGTRGSANPQARPGAPGRALVYPSP
jgi:hypothetical protein